MVLPPAGRHRAPLLRKRQREPSGESSPLLTEDLSSEQKAQLDVLLEMREGSPYSTSRMVAPSRPVRRRPRTILVHIERLRSIRELRISSETGRRVHQNRLLQIAREAAQTAVYHLKEYEPDRR